MTGFRKLSSIAVLLFAFAYPPSLAEAKDISLSNALNQQSAAPGATLVIAQGLSLEIQLGQRRPPLVPREFEQRQQFRRRQIIRQRQIRRQREFERRQQLRQRWQLRQRQLRRERDFRREQQFRGQWY